MKLEKVSESTWAVVDGSTYGNVGCIRIPNHLVVIDTGMTPPIAREFRELIHAEIGKPITEVILTHYHSDHVFGAQEFQAYPLIASSAMAALYPELLEGSWSLQGLEEKTQYYAKTDPAFSHQLQNLQIITPTHTFRKSETLGEKKEITIIHTGGHTVGHSMVYFAPERILFAGDLVFCQQYPYAGDPTNNPEQWMAVFETILKMPIEIIVPGHGPLCDKEEIRSHLVYFKALEQWIQHQIQQKHSLKSVLKARDTSPTPPYDIKADTRLELTVERWFTFYSELTLLARSPLPSGGDESRGL